MRTLSPTQGQNHTQLRSDEINKHPTHICTHKTHKLKHNLEHPPTHHTHASASASARISTTKYFWTVRAQIRAEAITFTAVVHYLHTSYIDIYTHTFLISRARTAMFAYVLYACTTWRRRRRRQGVDAVWPGWGHASENPNLPTRLTAEGIKFIGPTAPVMAVLGDKIAANILAQTAKVPSIPWSGDGLEAVLNDVSIRQRFCKSAVVSTDTLCFDGYR